MIGEDGQCTCDPCFCETPGEMSPVRSPSRQSFEGEADDLPPYAGEISNLGRGFNLTEFMRAKEYFLTASTNSGLSVYDHLSEVIRKMLDDRAPSNPVDFVEEISMNIKRYRFGMGKDLIRDAFYISPPVLDDASNITANWTRHALWSVEQTETGGEERGSFGGFPNLMRLLYYLEQINIGLPRDEMFRIALAIRQLTVTHPINRARFWGKIFGSEKNYYVVEAELKGDAGDDLWNPPIVEPELPAYLMDLSRDPTNVMPGAGATFQRAGDAVTDPEILTPYAETSGLPEGTANTFLPKPLAVSLPQEFYGEGLDPKYLGGAEDTGAAEAARWQQYQNELMTGFPEPRKEETIVTPPEGQGVGINRRSFYVCNDVGDKWFLLPDVNPQQINVSRNIRWHLSGNLDKKVQTFPEFPGLEGHYLRALLARVTAGSQVSPLGYFKRNRYGDEDEGEEEEYEDEDEDPPVDDKVFAVKKFRPPTMTELLNSNVERWVHHTSHILRQGRTTWWNPAKALKNQNLEDEDEEDVEEEEEEEGEAAREFGPTLFAPIAEDKTLDGSAPWSARASSSVFTEFQVASVRSNLWPGATAMCTSKGKVENIYFGDGLKFNSRTYAPPVPEEPQLEYREGPELTEITDPTVEEEQAWLAKLQLDEIADVEDKFVDNEEGYSDEDEDEDESEED